MLAWWCSFRVETCCCSKRTRFNYVNSCYCITNL